MIDVTNLQVTLGDKTILKNIHFHVTAGEFIGLIGPNGSGKTTLLKTIAHLIASKNGNIKIAGKDQKAFSHKEMARHLSYVPQDTHIDFNFNVKEIVSMGRHAHREFLQPSPADDEIIKEVMVATNTWRFRNNSILNLSGGQRQLVFIAKALAQDAPIILLDEPVSALDIYYQMHILKLLKTLTSRGKTVVTVLHDLNLAARFCEKLLLLRNGQVEAYGHSNEVLTEERLKETYHIDAKVRQDKLIQALNVTPL
ncbi:ABC transporter ATP-binding protein [Oceanobacillus alkalisoli]|uniref:ABC transporter ATP-binding protein n=1 Tax=Oceanobacillus alkalisoli TaxID=2925113 RepID=UPI001EE4526F|nr:ABC transporter ATP-binding protein [Oceanobacillus alkalisoli]MCG5105078.1 ABC transporter ATP-binding protein [Oceanobacillus alkalisoli]